MHKVSWLAALALSLLASGIQSAGAQTESPEKLDSTKAFRGEQSFRTYCSSCHGRQAKGDGPLAKELRVQPANLTELSKNNDGAFPFAMVIETINQGRSVRAHGTKNMPAWGDAFEMTEESEAAAREKLMELAHYLWSKQEKAK